MKRATVLLGHSYHRLSDAQLAFVIKDAGEARECMRGLNEVAENKYADQVNDACTILNDRRTRKALRAAR